MDESNRAQSKPRSAEIETIGFPDGNEIDRREKGVNGGENGDDEEDLSKGGREVEKTKEGERNLCQK